MPIDVGHTFTKKKKSENTYVWDALPDDMYQVEILDLEAGIDETPYGGGPAKEIINISFVVLEDKTFEGEFNGNQPTRGRRLWLKVNPNMSAPGDYPASKIYQIASCAFGGKNYTKLECDNFPYNSLIGRQIRLGVKSKTSKNTGRDYNQITAFFKPLKALAPYDPELDGFKKKDTEVPF